MHDLLLELGLLGHSGWLLGQEDELSGCSDGTATEETVSGTGAGADADAGAGDLA
jgi:hypothetical protein